MTYKLSVNSNNPPTDALVLIELINAINKEKVEVIWCKELKGKGNVNLTNCQDVLLGERSYDVSRYFARTTNTDLYGGTTPDERTKVDHWLSIAIGPLSCTSLKEETLSYLDHVLMTNTWLVSKHLTLADIHVFAILLESNFIEKYEKQFSNISRWYKQILSLAAVVKALEAIKKNRTSLPNDQQSEKVVGKQPSARKQEGKFIDLPGAEMGKVVVRFPPEASGYLHIGHAKAALLNQYYAETFQGQLIMRFDDTNPAKENVEFEQAILEDLELLQIKPDRFTHSSDYFDLMLDYCTKLIKEGKAYVDDTPANIMKEQREQKLKSTNWDNSIEKNLKLWEEMQRGTAKGQECCVRAKIDYQSVNGCLRDPTIYRCKPEPHPRTGTKYKVYPTYDFACPIVDAIENVTHTLRTTEYHDRDAQFYWIIDALGLRRPYIWEYSRLNMTNTVLSKRKLTWFVTEGLVDGWDDPRFPTVRGILRRGMTVEGLKQFIIAQGSSRSVVFMEWDKIWAFNKKVIDPIAIRYTALDYDKTVPVEIANAKEEWVTVQNHPKDASIGTKKILTSQTIYIEKDDAEALTEGQNTTFINWGNILIKKIEKENGRVKKILGMLNLENKDYKNTLKVTWLALPSANSKHIKDADLIPCYAVYFDHIISKPVLKNDEDFSDFVAKNTRTEVRMLGEPELRRVKKGEIIQLQRKGFFRCDVPYADASAFSSREQPIILFHVPDGHTAPAKTTANASPAKTAPSPEVTGPSCKLDSADAINEKIAAQGDKVRRLKTEKADKNVIDAEVKILLSLKAEYKACTGNEWKPGIVLKASPKKSKASNGKPDLQGEIRQQEVKIKELQDKINQAMLHLATLKTEYKNKTGAEWSSGETQAVNECKLAEKDTDILSNEIQKQGDKVRQLKSTKSDKSVIDQEVKTLLALKCEYKAVTGQEWKPSGSPAKAKASNVSQKVVVGTREISKPVALVEEKATTHKEQLSNEIQAQGDKVRQLKNSKSAKGMIQDEVNKLLKLKADYKAATGQEWKAVSSPAKVKPSKELDDAAIHINKLYNVIHNQAEKIKELKGLKAYNEIIDQELQILLSLKNDYKTITNQEWKAHKSPESTPEKEKKEDSPKADKRVAKAVVKSEKNIEADTKTGTRLGLEAKKEENFFDWYSQIITKTGMIEYYDVSGCYILRPWSFGIWKIIKEYIDKEITQMGVQECYFPIFVTKSVLEKEKTHIADFAPEVAWVTKCGNSDLAEPIAIRPTSETVMYPAYAKWLKSDTELPLRLNQWNNVVRWEFKDPKPFLRTREFLWQEGHTAFATKSEADEEVLTILDMYARVYEDLLAVPVIKGRKTEKEKFAGGDYTTTVEAFIPTSGRGIQGATSHHLGQNFSKMFNIQVEGVTGGDEKTFVYQNSWGLTTRTVGVMIMVHGDDKGLVLPPNVASIQAVIVPCGISAEQKEMVSKECQKLMEELSECSTLRLEADYRNNRTTGWKFNHWELKGVPVRIELGPKDLKKNQVTFVRRDTSERIVVARAEVLPALRKLLTDIQSDMLARAKTELYKHIKQTTDWNEFCSELNKKNMLLSPFCGDSLCEDSIKTNSAREDAGTEPGALSMGAKSLCIPFDQPESSTPINKQKCIYPDCQNKPKFYTLFGRSY